MDTFRAPLIGHYRETNQLSRLDDDLAYLSRAYQRTESWWHGNFEKMQDVRLVILGEAPLFGPQESYIYNPHSKLTSFLLPSSLHPLAQGRQPKTKADMLATLQALGIIILDIFPYALNSGDTPFGYRALKYAVKLKLAQESKEFHLQPKLEALRSKNTDIRFCARYAAIRDIANVILPSHTEKSGIWAPEMPVISMQGGMIDKNKLQQVFDGRPVASSDFL